MKLRFIVLTLLLLLTRGVDFYSTSLWYFRENGRHDEMNPLASLLGAGWNTLVLVNAALVGLIIFCYYHYCFKYRPELSTDRRPRNFREYASLLYFNQPGKFFQIFYRIPANRSVLYAHMGYVLIHTLIIAGLLAALHNFSQFYGFSFYQGFREWVGRPLYVIYAVIGLAGLVFYYSFLAKAFRKYRKQQEGRAS